MLSDGGEADLDLGNYERFLDVLLASENNITTGKIYSEVLTRERKGEYLGKTVQVVPHVTDAIQEWIMRVATREMEDGGRAEICVIELGGTIGDIESMPFVEALRQLRYNVGDVNFCSVFVSLVPELGVVGEQKTKPTQHGVKMITSMGLSPQLIVCRSERPLLPETKRKLALFCQVAPDAVASVHDVSNTYKIPMMLQEQGVCNLLIRQLQLVWRLPVRLEKWETMARKADIGPGTRQVNICLVGKYTGLSDAYLSVLKALEHAGMAVGMKVNVNWLESSHLEYCSDKRAANGDVEQINGDSNYATSANGNNPKFVPRPGSPQDAERASEDAWKKLRAADGILVPGGFGDRGVEGKIRAIAYARECDVPFLGVCYGMQMAVVEAVRRVFKEPKANSEEVNKDAPIKAVVYMPEVDKTKMGGTMRLGLRETVLKPDSISGWLYGKVVVKERHRHRYEVNYELVDRLEREGGLEFVGRDVKGERMEVVESKNNRYFVGTQFHPEFLTRPGRASPPFVGLVMAAGGMDITKEAVDKVMKNIRHEDPWAD